MQGSDVIIKEPKIIERKLIAQANTLVVTMPPEWLRRFSLVKGDVVNLVVCEYGIVIVDSSEDFNSKELKRELDLAQKLWDERDNRELINWFKKLSEEEQAKVKKRWKETEQELCGEWNHPQEKGGAVRVKRSELKEQDKPK